MDENELETELEQGSEQRSQPAKPKPAAKPTQRQQPAEPAVDHAREIASIGEQYGATELAMRSIAAGDTVDQFKDKLLDAQKQRQQSSESESTMLDLGLSDKELRRYSLMNVVRGLATGNFNKFAAFEREVSDAMAARMGKDAHGLFVPYEVMGAGLRQQSVGTAAKGGNLVATELHSELFIEALRQESVIGMLGARMLSGLVGNVDIPKQAGTASFYWVGEDVEPTGSDLDFGLVQLTPRTVAGYVPITRKLMLQTSGDIEALVRADLLKGLAEALDNDLLATILAASGIGAEVIGGTAAAPTPTWANIVALETDVEEANAAGEGMAYVMRPTMKGKLKSTEKASNTAQFLWGSDNTVNGYRAASTTQMAAGHILFGRFSQAMMGLWGAVDLVVDKSTKASTGGTVLRIFQDADSAIRHAGAFSLGATSDA